MSSSQYSNTVFYQHRLIIGLGYAVLVWWTPSVRSDGGFPLYYYAIVLLSYAFHQVPLTHAHLLFLTSWLGPFLLS